MSAIKQEPIDNINCKILWNTLSLDEWEERFGRIVRSNLLQSYDYARAICPIQHQKARWGLIMVDGEEAGLVQILEAGIAGNLLHAVVLDRGPLWFGGYGAQEQMNAFFEVFHREFPRRFGRKRRIIPETTVFESDRDYKRLETPGYQTIWVDLRPNEADLRAGLKQKWRNMLNKAEKSDLSVEWDKKGVFLPWLLRVYQEDRVKKGYHGPAADVLEMIARTFGEKENLLIGRVMSGKEAVAAVLVLCHGKAATYQIGWTGEEGRKLAAQNFLLWHTMLELKDRGICDFDLGGINDETAKNVKKFKEGLGGQAVTLAGQYF